MKGKKSFFKFETQPICKELNIVNLVQKKREHIKQIKTEVRHRKIEENLKTKEIKDRIKVYKENIEKDLCSLILNSFWDRNEHKISLPYIEGFDESKIPTKARPIQMNHELLEYCKQEIKDLLSKGLIKESHSPWSCIAFYVNKPSKIERGTQRLLFSYKPLNKVLRWIRCPIQNKKDLIKDCIMPLSFQSLI